MNFNEYQKEAIKTLINNDNTPNELLARLTLGLCGEAGEIAEKVKKYLRDTKQSPKDRIDMSQGIEKELGDLLWYISSFATNFYMKLDKIAEKNLIKLTDRQIKNKITGNGDNR